MLVGIFRAAGKRLHGLIVAILIAGAFGAPRIASAQVFRTDEAMPLATKYPSDAILGEWCTQKEENRPPGRIKFVRAADGTYTGIVSWLSEPTKDVHNKDPKLRDRPVVGIVLMWHLRYEDGEYVDGYVYNPEDGDTYRFKAEVLSPESLQIRGYLLVPLLGQNKVWTRFHPVP
jgi:uncharacterized protein (DUF2147 family)